MGTSLVLFSLSSIFYLSYPTFPEKDLYLQNNLETVRERIFWKIEGDAVFTLLSIIMVMIPVTLWYLLQTYIINIKIMPCNVNHQHTQVTHIHTHPTRTRPLKIYRGVLKIEYLDVGSWQHGSIFYVFMANVLWYTHITKCNRLYHRPYVPEYIEFVSIGGKKFHNKFFFTMIHTLGYCYPKHICHHIFLRKKFATIPLASTWKPVVVSNLSKIYRIRYIVHMNLWFFNHTVVSEIICSEMFHNIMNPRTNVFINVKLF